MSIRVICPNGHVLNVKDKYDGKKGLCPTCKVAIKVPDPAEVFTEESIMDVLMPHESGLSGISLAQSDAETPAEDEWKSQSSIRQRICSKCFEEIPVDSNICPQCKTYISAYVPRVHSDLTD